MSPIFWTGTDKCGERVQNWKSNHELDFSEYLRISIHNILFVHPYHFPENCTTDLKAKREHFSTIQRFPVHSYIFSEQKTNILLTGGTDSIF